MAEKLEITLKKSLCGCRKDQIATAKGLGLRRPNKKVILSNTPAIRGMIKKISHLLSVKEEEK